MSTNCMHKETLENIKKIKLKSALAIIQNRKDMQTIVGVFKMTRPKIQIKDILKRTINISHKHSKLEKKHLYHENFIAEMAKNLLLEINEKKGGNQK